jgi:protein-tyrosine sulfotransferase
MRVQGLGRQLYVDLVRARSRVRIVPAQANRPSGRPIFVIGIYRSGTTLLRYVLDSHPRIASPPETNFLPILGAMLDDPGALEGLNSMGFDRAHVTSRIRTECDYFYDNYAASCGKPRWVDKTPSYIDHLPLLHEIFPDAQYVVIHRNPLDQIHSHTKGGTFVHEPLAPLLAKHGDLRVAAAHYWVNQSELIMSSATTHPPAVVITYEQLCLRPKETIERVLSAIGEPWRDSVLDFHGQSHDQGKEAASIQRIKGFRLQTGGYLGWAPDLLATCRAIVKETAATVGYEVESA